MKQNLVKTKWTSAELQFVRSRATPYTKIPTDEIANIEQSRLHFIGLIISLAMIKKWKETNKWNLSLHSRYHAKGHNEFVGPIFASLRPDEAALYKEMPQRWRAVRNTVSDLTGPRFEHSTSRSRDKRATSWPTGDWPL